MWPGPARWGASASLQPSASQALPPARGLWQPVALGSPGARAGRKGSWGGGSTGSRCLKSSPCSGRLRTGRRRGYPRATDLAAIGLGLRQGAVGPPGSSELCASWCRGHTVCQAHLCCFILPLEEMRVLRGSDEHIVGPLNGEGGERGPPEFPSRPPRRAHSRDWNLLLPQSLGEPRPGVGRGPEPPRQRPRASSARLPLISRSTVSRLPGALKELTRNASPLWFCGRNHDCQEQIFVVHKVCY